MNHKKHSQLFSVCLSFTVNVCYLGLGFEIYYRFKYIFVSLRKIYQNTHVSARLKNEMHVQVMCLGLFSFRLGVGFEK